MKIKYNFHFKTLKKVISFKWNKLLFDVLSNCYDKENGMDANEIQSDFPMKVSKGTIFRIIKKFTKENVVIHNEKTIL